MASAAEQVRATLVTLAELSPATDARTRVGSIPTDWFRWLPAGDAAFIFSLEAPLPRSSVDLVGTVVKLLVKGPIPDTRPGIAIDRDFGDQLMAVDALRPEQNSLRVGWLFVTGTTTNDDGATERHFWPLISRPVKVRRSVAIGSHELVPVGDTELTRRVADRDLRHELEKAPQYGGGGLTNEVVIPEALLSRLDRLRRFAIRAAAASGVDASQLIAATDAPDSFIRHDGLVIVAGLAVYAATSTGGTSHAASLRTWATQRLDTRTAMHALYSDVDPTLSDVDLTPTDADVPGTGIDPSSSAHSVVTPFLLTPTQRHAVASSRHKELTVVNGAPGTGKSHTITAIAYDALARRQSVLVVARSDATVDALIELFERAPGPRPVVFGSNERKDVLAGYLAAGLLPCTTDELTRAAGRLADAVEQRNDLWGQLSTLLEAEAEVSGTPAPPNQTRRWPELRTPENDLGVLNRLLQDCVDPHGWTARRRATRAADRLRQRTGAQSSADRAQLTSEIAAARSHLAATTRIVAEGLEIGGRWKDLRHLDDELRWLCAKWLDLDERAPDRLTRASLAAVAALATALRSGRAARREQLTRMGDELTVALPLWVGTLSDVDDLLPGRLALFDLVILDEASSIDQPAAASSLLRGTRAVVVGDPRQLRHVSFVGDAERDDALATAGIALDTPLAARLDVRRNSVFDVATGAAPTITLDEHFRSRPHLVEFVAHRLYGGQVHVATRSPATETVDCIELVRVSGHRNAAGVVAAEVSTVIDRLQKLSAQGATSVGVISPFRAQADALEAAILQRFGVDEIEMMGLRVGTVHAFVGNERDIVIASLGLDAGAKASSWRFVNDPHLFAVLATRAREHFVVIRSADPPDGTLLADYLAQADIPPGPPGSHGRGVNPWTHELAQVLGNAGHRVVIDYPTGRHTVDVCVGNGYGFFGLECSVHHDGADAHIERHLSLDRRGWPLIEAFESKWVERRGELFVQLRERAALGYTP